MKQCDICNQLESESGLTSTYVIDERHRTKRILLCRTCIDYLCDDVKMGEWFLLKRTDEMVKLPEGFYMRL